MHRYEIRLKGKNVGGKLGAVSGGQSSPALVRKGLGFRYGWEGGAETPQAADELSGREGQGRKK